MKKARITLFNCLFNQACLDIMEFFKQLLQGQILIQCQDHQDMKLNAELMVTVKANFLSSQITLAASTRRLAEQFPVIAYTLIFISWAAFGNY